MLENLNLAPQSMVLSEICKLPCLEILEKHGFLKFCPKNLLLNNRIESLERNRAWFFSKIYKNMKFE